MPNTGTVQSGTIASAISGATVGLLHEYTGRGPTKARTYIWEDFITVVLQDTLTMGERSLVRDGRADLVLTTRKAFQRTMGPQLIAAVEEHTGRIVEAFLSDNHIDPDVAVESFVLAPRNTGKVDIARANAGAPM
ncbi:MAG TPA: Na-translocating system protein MpsC family protein [Solirubrobacteraceae bacterium]|nr:Na-translocating system protein MpsC family protein [Solirubrobacteraceae bacterium]